MAKGRFNGSIINKMQLKLPALSANEGMARAAVAAFCSQLDPSAVDIADIKCAVSEAVTNCIVHAYRYLADSEEGYIYISARLYDNREITVEISDNGCGIADVDAARAPMFTTGGEERCGMGFLVMESFTDSLNVKSKLGKGTTVLMRKKLKP